MRDHTALLRALEYIEAHITDELEPADAARYCHLSLSALQKLFRHVFDYSVKEYIAKRRLTLAARELAAAGGSVLELALKYGYAGPETFARAFRRLWGVSPSEFRKSAVAVDLFPPLRLEEGENDRLVYRENQMLYDRLLQCPDSAVVCFDLVGLKEINRISRSDGDRAILEAARRIAGLCTGTERLFRLGADEFALLTEGSCTALYRRACHAPPGGTGSRCCARAAPFP